MPRRGDYLFRRKGSSNWWIRFQYPEHLHAKLGKKIEISLKTPDRRVAEVEALAHVRLHKLLIYGLKADMAGRATPISRCKYAPGERILSQGTKVFVTPTLIHYLDDAGEVIRTEPNVETTMMFDLEPEEEREWLEVGLAARPELATKRAPTSASDDAHFERWIKHRRVSGYLEREARAAWETFRKLTNGKRLADCDKDDGRKLVAYFDEQGNKRATIQKKIGHLAAAVKLAIDEGKLKFNPFSGILPKKHDEDAVRREDFTDEDMALFRKLGPSVFKSEDEWKLWVLLATTGMRLSEAIQIEDEKTEHGVRYVQIRRGKTKQSIRDVPLPDAFLALQPVQIVGRLFPDWRPAPVSKLMNRRIDQIGIKDERKVIHSLRHRAKSKLRKEQECPEKIEYAILGHELVTVAARYGKRPPMTVLKPWIEKIGY